MKVSIDSLGWPEILAACVGLALIIVVIETGRLPSLGSIRDIFRVLK